MSTTRTLNDLVQLLDKNNIAEADALAFAQECSHFQDPETINVMYQLLDAFHSTAVLSEDLKNKLGIEKSINDLLVLIPDTVQAIEQARLTTPTEDKSDGETLVRQVIENLIFIIQLKPDENAVTGSVLTHEALEEKAKELTAPLDQALDEVKKAMVVTEGTQSSLSEGFVLYLKFVATVKILVGIGLIAFGVASLPFAGIAGVAVAAYCGGMCFGMATWALSIVHEDSVKKANAAAPPQKNHIDTAAPEETNYKRIHDNAAKNRHRLLVHQHSGVAGRVKDEANEKGGELKSVVGSKKQS